MSEIFDPPHILQQKMEKKYAGWSLRVTSVHGDKAPVPFIKTIETSFPGRPKLKAAVLNQEPFVLKMEVLKTGPLKVVLKLNFSDGCGCQCTRIEFPVNFQAPLDNFNQDKNATRTLRERAIQDQFCGQFSLVKRQIHSYPKKETTILDVATNIVWYVGSFPSSQLSEAHLESKYNLAKRFEKMNVTKVPMKKQKVH